MEASRITSKGGRNAHAASELLAGSAARPGARAARLAALAISDLTALVLSCAAAYLVWALPVKGQSALLYLDLFPLVVLFLVGYAVVGLYPGFGLGPVETLRRLSWVTAFGFLVLAAFSFVLKLPPLYSRVTFVFALGFSLVLVPLVRAAAVRAASRLPWWHEPVVVIGTGARAVQSIRSLRQAWFIGYRPVAVLALDLAAAPDSVEGVPVAGGAGRAREMAAQGIRVALLEIDAQSGPLLDALQRDFRHVVLLRQYDDLPVEGLQVRNLGSLVGIEYSSNLLMPGNRIVKRAIDVAVAAPALAVAAPLIAVAAALVWLADRGPAFFTQIRAGLDGRPITVPKVRTMRRDAERGIERYLASRPELREEWEKNFKLRDDPRLVPGLGRLFRRLSIDELPQLWTVLRGDMSLVGPRPFPEYHLRQFPPAFLELRQRVRPGITGLWQVTVRSEGGTEQQEAYDSYYIRNWSVWLDIYVLSRTLAAWATGRGAY